MKSIITKIIATTILGAASLSAFAQATTPTQTARDAANMQALDQYPVVPFHSTKTRAEVKAELIAAQRAGTITNGDDYPIQVAAESHKTRAQVQQELVQAQRDGTITNGDDYPIIKPAASHKTRAEVTAEVAMAHSSAARDALYNGY